MTLLPLKRFGVMLITACIIITFLSPVYAERAKRPMTIHQVDELGLEIWTERNPEWPTQQVNQGKQPMFIAQSPLNSYPSAVMMWMSFPKMRVTAGDLETIAGTAIRTAADNYHVPADQALSVNTARYGALTGYEATFDGQADGEVVSVKMFVGHQLGKGLVSMQVYTGSGKLAHLNEHIRRSWQNIKYQK